MQATQISFLTTDNVKLYGLSYQPSKSNRLAIYIHGAGDSSIIKSGDLLQAISSRIVKHHFDLMAFDNRGSRYVSKIKKYNSSGELIGMEMAGMAYEKIADCTKDIAAAIEWGVSQNYKEFILIGHSTGANKIVFYLTERADHSNKVSKAILLGGGDDVTLQNSRLNDPIAYQNEIKLRIKDGKGQELVPEVSFPGCHPISYGSLLELIKEGSDYDIFPFGRFKKASNNLFSRYRELRIPTVAIYGSEDSGTVIPACEALKILKNINSNTKTVLLKGADHNFANMHDQLAREIAREMQ